MARVSAFLFVDDLHLVRMKASGGPLFTLSRDYRVFFKLDTRDYMLTVPNGFQTDFASIPRPLQGIVEKLGNHIEAAVVHDYLCVKRPWSSIVAADVFKQAMIVSNMPEDTLNVMYLGVRYGGPQWSDGEDWLNAR